MAQKPTRIPVNVATRKARPGQDMAVFKKQGAQFPAVGMTMPSYQYDPRDRHKLPGPTVVKMGWWKRMMSRFSVKRIAIVFFILLALVGGFLAVKFVYNAHKIFGGNILNVLTPTKLDGEDVGRVNILLAGNSA